MNLITPEFGLVFWQTVARKMVAQVKHDQEVLLRTTHIERTKIIEEAMATQRLIIKEAKVEAEQSRKEMIEQTRVLLAKEQEAALNALKNIVATLAIQIAEKLLQNELKQQHTQEELVQRLIKDIHWR